MQNSDLFGLSGLLNPRRLRRDINIEQVEARYVGQYKPVEAEDNIDERLAAYSESLKHMASRFVDGSGIGAISAMNGHAPIAREPKRVTFAPAANIVVPKPKANDFGSLPPARPFAPDSRDDSDEEDNIFASLAKDKKSFEIEDDSSASTPMEITTPKLPVPPANPWSVSTPMPSRSFTPGYSSISPIAPPVASAPSAPSFPSFGSLGGIAGLGATSGAMTNAQGQREHIQSVFNDLRTTSAVHMTDEQEQDIKMYKIEQIESLRQTLEEGGANITHIKLVNINSSMQDIDSVLGLLRSRNDRIRFSTMANGFTLLLADGLEYAFDGNRAIPILGWKPDYTGFNTTARARLQGLSYETSQIVGDFVRKHNIGPKTRFMIEFLPSLIGYPVQRSREKSQPGLNQEMRYGAALINIKDANEPIKEMENV